MLNNTSFAESVETDASGNLPSISRHTEFLKVLATEVETNVALLAQKLGDDRQLGDKVQKHLVTELDKIINREQNFAEAVIAAYEEAKHSGAIILHDLDDTWAREDRLFGNKPIEYQRPGGEAITEYLKAQFPDVQTGILSARSTEDIQAILSPEGILSNLGTLCNATNGPILSSEGSNIKHTQLERLRAIGKEAILIDDSSEVAKSVQDAGFSVVHIGDRLADATPFPIFSNRTQKFRELKKNDPTSASEISRAFREK
jgi:hypothetical protein